MLSSIVQASVSNLNLAGFLSLLQVLQNLGKDRFPPQSFEQVGTRIAKVLEKVSPSRLSRRQV